MSLINISSYVFDKPTKWKILVTSNPVISFEDRNEAHWPGRDQCYQEHLDILLCLLSTVLLEEVIMKCTQKLSFPVGLKEKKFTLVLLRDQQMYQTTRSKWFKNGAEKTTSPVFFQSYWRFEPLSYLKTHITSLSSSLLIFIFCLAGHCFYRLTKHYHKTSPFFVFSPVRTFSGWL